MVENVTIMAADNCDILRCCMPAIMVPMKLAFDSVVSLQTTPAICHRQHIVKTQILSEFEILTKFGMRNMNVRA